MTAVMTAINPVAYSNPSSGATADGGGSSQQAATITANDFLLLLVTEMKNQDPTAQTDPNEYINQLVQVNSLQQLIEINQELSSAVGSADSGSAGSATGHVLKDAEAPTAMAAPAAQTKGAHSSADLRTATPPAAAHDFATAHGNLTVPRGSPAAQRIATALSGRK